MTGKPIEAFGRDASRLDVGATKAAVREADAPNTTNTIAVPEQRDREAAEKARELYFCARCKSIVRETDAYGSFVAGKCRCEYSPSPWTPVSEQWSGLLPKFRPGGTHLPKSIELARGLLPHASTVSVDIALDLYAYLDAAYERLASLPRHRLATQPDTALIEALDAYLDAMEANEAEARRSEQPGARAWSSAPTVHMLHKLDELRRLVGREGVFERTAAALQKDRHHG